jgi:hypothetical protein
MSAIVSASELRSVLGVSSSLYNDAYLGRHNRHSEGLVILPLLVSEFLSGYESQARSRMSLTYYTTLHTITSWDRVLSSHLTATFNGTYTVTAVDG